MTKKFIVDEVHKMLKDKTLTYISLFSCAGVGCFGLKKAGFECVATNELIERRCINCNTSMPGYVCCKS